MSDAIYNRANARYILLELLQSGCDPDQRDKYGSTPLHSARSAEIARLLAR